MALAFEQPETSMLRCCVTESVRGCGVYANEKCGRNPTSALIRTAGNAYFTQLMSVISLPDSERRASRKAVENLVGISSAKVEGRRAI